MGFEPIGTTENPHKLGFICWIYDKTPELVEALNSIIGGNCP